MEQLAKQREVWLAGEAKLKAWHAQTEEEALEPGLEIVDPHHHLWDYRQLMGFNLMGLFKQQYYMTDELVDDIVGAGHNVTRTVYVEAHAFHSKDGPDPALMVASAVPGPRVTLVCLTSDTVCAQSACATVFCF